jgi:Mg/Co/Ni transporter MgtE
MNARDILDLVEQVIKDNDVYTEEQKEEVYSEIRCYHLMYDAAVSHDVLWGDTMDDLLSLESEIEEFAKSYGVQSDDYTHLID